MTDHQNVHFAGPHVTIDGRRRQLCAWCGHVLLDTTHTAGLLDGEQPPPPWPDGHLIRIEDGVGAVVPYQHGKGLPPGCCALPNDEPVDPNDGYPVDLCGKHTGNCRCRRLRGRSRGSGTWGGPPAGGCACSFVGRRSTGRPVPDRSRSRRMCPRAVWTCVGKPASSSSSRSSYSSSSLGGRISSCAGTDFVLRWSVFRPTIRTVSVLRSAAFRGSASDAFRPTLRLRLSRYRTVTGPSRRPDAGRSAWITLACSNRCLLPANHTGECDDDPHPDVAQETRATDWPAEETDHG